MQGSKVPTNVLFSCEEVQHLLLSLNENKNISAICITSHDVILQDLYYNIYTQQCCLIFFITTKKNACEIVKWPVGVLRKKNRYFNNHSVRLHRKFLHDITLLSSMVFT